MSVEGEREGTPTTQRQEVLLCDRHTISDRYPRRVSERRPVARRGIVKTNGQQFLAVSHSVSHGQKGGGEKHFTGQG